MWMVRFCSTESNGDAAARPAGPHRCGPPPTPSAFPNIPAALLQRHGARVLDPAEAARRPGKPPPQSTVYRYGTLLIPNNLLESYGALCRFNEILGSRGLALVPPRPLVDVIGKELLATGIFDDLPRPVALVAIGDTSVKVDAWAALQDLKMAIGEPEPDGIQQGNAPRRSIGLEHLLIGSALAGAGGLDGTNSPTHGGPASSNPFSWLRYDVDGRLPLQIVMDPPARSTRPENEDWRRPVVAVLDTGYYEHPWFTVTDRAGKSLGDESVIVDPCWQAMIERNGGGVQNGDLTPRVPIEGYLDTPQTGEPLVGDPSTHFGHATFIHGLIRQIAPEARVFAIRVMHSDGVAYESDLLLALRLITAEATRYRDGVAGALPIDVVSLSAGYFPETPDERTTLSQFVAAIGDLCKAGVAMFAAAGNYATSREFQPAALANEIAAPDRAPLVSVGALNPNGTVAQFSDQADWVQCYASGVAVVSAFPQVDFSANAPSAVVAFGRQALDLDNFCAGVASWHGSSFATPIVAAAMTVQLQKLGLKPGDGKCATDRTQKALKNLRDQSNQSGQKCRCGADG